MLKQLSALATEHRELHARKVIEQVSNYKMAIRRYKAGWSPAYPDQPDAEQVTFDLFIEKDEKGMFILSCVSKDNLLFDDERHATLSEAKERAKELWGVCANEWLLA